MSDAIEIFVDGETHEVQDPDRAGAIVTGALLANADRVELARNGAAGDDVAERLDEAFGRATAPDPATEPEASADHDDVEAAVADVEADQAELVDEDPADAEPDVQEGADDVGEELPEFEELVEEVDGEGDDQADETPEPPQDQSETDQDDAEPNDVDDFDGAEDLGTFEVKSYALVLHGDVQDYFADDAERVTVREGDGRYELAAGSSEGWPDYAISDIGIQVGNPGKDVLGVDAGDEVVATADGDVVVLEVVGEDQEDQKSDEDDDPDDEDGDDSAGFECDNCGDGFETERGLTDHRAKVHEDRGDEDDWDSLPRECCGVVCETHLEWYVHRTESHGVTQANLDNLEPGEFESIVEEANQVADIFEAVPWSSERTLRMLGVYGLEDVIGGNVELSDLTDFEFDGIDDVDDQEEPDDDHQEPAAEPEPAPEPDRPDPDDPDYDGAAYKPAALQGGGS